MSFLDNLSYPLLIGIALWMLFAPFSPEPHLVEKFRMFGAGTLHRPVDIFDVFWHLLPLALLTAKAAREWAKKGAPAS